jgi:tetratricopeptide (TPR) repeat protein
MLFAFAGCEGKPKQDAVHTVTPSSLWEARFRRYRSRLDSDSLEKDERPVSSLRIVDVSRGSQAMACGVGVGDMICKINGKAAYNMHGGEALRGQRPDMFEIWSHRSGRRTLPFDPEPLGVSYTEHWIPVVAYVRSSERDPAWDDYVLAAASYWDKDTTFAEEALRRAREVGYKGWFAEALTIAMARENGQLDRAVERGMAWDRKMPASSMRPVVHRLFRAAIADARIEEAKAILKEFGPSYAMRGDWNPEELWRRFERLTPNEEALLGPDRGLRKEVVSRLDGEMKGHREISREALHLLRTRGRFRRITPPNKATTFEYTPFTASPAFELAFTYRVTSPKVTTRLTPRLIVSLMDASVGDEYPVVEVTVKGDHRFEVEVEGYPPICYKRSALLRPTGVNSIKMYVISPWCEVWLNDRRIFLGLTPRAERMLFPRFSSRSLTIEVSRVSYAELAPLKEPRRQASRSAGEAAQATVAIPERPSDKTLGWFYDLFAESYLEHGKRDRAWDAEALQAAALAARYWGRDPERVEPYEVLSAAKKAYDKGCDDPLIGLIRAEMLLLLEDDDSRDAARALTSGAAQMAHSSLPPLIRFWILNGSIHVASWSRLGPTKERIAGESRLAAGLIGEVLADKDAPAWFVRRTFPYLTRDRSKRYNRLEEFARYHGAIIAADPEGSLGPTFKGFFYDRHAWEARGGGWAGSVTEKGWKLFRERLEVAYEALMKAVERDPSNSDAYAKLIDVGRGLGQPYRRQLEYFAKAFEADPQNWQPYQNMIWSLTPRWGGSEAAMREFAEACFARIVSNPDADIRHARVMVKMHRHLGDREYRRSDVQDERISLEQRYWSRAIVWQDVQRVYDAILEKRPNSRLSKSEYASWATDCRQWEAARRLYQELGDELVAAPFGSRERAERDRLEAVNAAKGQAEEKRDSSGTSP